LSAPALIWLRAMPWRDCGTRTAGGIQAEHAADEGA
jgi:hypothetical protein